MPRRDQLIAALLALVAVALGVAVLFSDLAAAAWPGRSGPIVYLGVRQGELPYEPGYLTTGLRVFDPGVPGSARVLTTDPGDADPQVSPDGRLVVFSRIVSDEFPGPVTRLFAIAIDGSGLRPLATAAPENLSDDEPAFYPSGQSIVFVRSGGAEGGDLYSVRLDGTNLRQVTVGSARERAPVVSPRGGQIAFTCGSGEAYARIEDVCSIRPDGSHRRILTRALKPGAEPFDPDFSPSGRQIAFTLGPGTAADVFTMRADGSRLSALTNRSPSGRRTFPRKVGYASPSYAPGAAPWSLSPAAAAGPASSASASATPAIRSGSTRADLPALLPGRRARLARCESALRPRPSSATRRWSCSTGSRRVSRGRSASSSSTSTPAARSRTGSGWR
jgi:dipeptidyl aminopeptidase/acylaminoacyl peptidase